MKSHTEYYSNRHRHSINSVIRQLDSMLKNGENAQIKSSLTEMLSLVEAAKKITDDNTQARIGTRKATKRCLEHIQATSITADTVDSDRRDIRVLKNMLKVTTLEIESFLNYGK